MENYERLAVEVKKAIDAAFRIAQKRDSANVTSVDLVLGLMDEDDSQANLILRKLDVDMIKLRLDLMAAQSGRNPTRRLPVMTSKVHAIIEGGREQAKRFPRDNAHTGHLLLAAIKEPSNEAGIILRTFKEITLKDAEEAAYELDAYLTREQFESR